MNVEPIGEDGAAAFQVPVDPAGETNREGLDAGRERDRIRRLDEEMQVGLLNGELDDPEEETERACSDRDENFVEERSLAQARDTSHEAEGDVRGKFAGAFFPRNVRDIGSRGAQGAPSTETSTAPTDKLEFALR